MKKSSNGNARKRVCLVLAVCWMTVIFAFSARDADLSTQDSMSVGMLFGRFIVPSFADMDAQMQVSFAGMLDHPIRKLAHATEYAVLGFLLAGSYMDKKRKRADIRIPIIIGALYAISDELHQLFIPGRSCEVMDMLIDSSGVLVGALIGLLAFTHGKRQGGGRKQAK